MADATNKSLGTRLPPVLRDIAQRLVLTTREKKVVAFILLAFLLGLGTKYYRDNHPAAKPVVAKKTAALSSTQRKRVGKTVAP